MYKIKYKNYIYNIRLIWFWISVIVKKKNLINIKSSQTKSQIFLSNLRFNLILPTPANNHGITKT